MNAIDSGVATLKRSCSSFVERASVRMSGHRTITIVAGIESTIAVYSMPQRTPHPHQFQAKNNPIRMQLHNVHFPEARVTTTFDATRLLSSGPSHVYLVSGFSRYFSIRLPMCLALIPLQYEHPMAKQAGSSKSLHRQGISMPPSAAPTASPTWSF